MLGFLIAGIIALVNFLNHMALEVTFLRSTHFLFQWYIITTIIMGVLMLIFTLGIIGAGTAAGGVLGFLGTSAVSLIGWIIFTFRRALFLAGAYLLSTAMNYASGIPQWDTAKLVVGGLLLFIALITRGREEQNFKQQLMPFKPTNERRRESMNDLKKETNTKFKSSFLLVLIILAALAVLIWFVVLPRINPPAPPPVPQPPVVIEETIPPPPPPVEPVRAIGDVKPPKLVKQVAPVYPEEARQARVEGIVILECTTDVDGNVAAVKVLRSIPLLDQAAIDAVRQWKYEPMIIDGKAHPVVFTVTVRFQLN